MQTTIEHKFQIGDFVNHVAEGRYAEPWVVSAIIYSGRGVGYWVTGGSGSLMTTGHFIESETRKHEPRA